MPAPFSVIIPTLNSADRLGPCLASVALGLEYGVVHEVIFADGGSSDKIENVADAVGAVLRVAPMGRGSQLANGAAGAKADWLLFLHGDTVLAEDWPRIATAHINQNPDKAGYFKLAFDKQSLAAKTVAGWANWRARVFGLPYGDQGLLISQRLYEQVGGFCDIPLMEDVAMAKALKGRICRLNCVATTSAARYQKNGWLRQSLRNFWLLMGYKLGVDPHRLAKTYRK